jgi:predicted ester cyclase
MDLEANKALVRRYVEMWETGNVALADEVLTTEYVDHTHPNRAPGPESVKEEVLTFRAGFPDARISIEQMVGEGDTVAFRFVLRGTHQGTFAGFAPTGKEAILNGVDFIRIAEGVMVELWSSQETLSWVLQLGAKVSTPCRELCTGRAF